MTSQHPLLAKEKKRIKKLLWGNCLNFLKMNSRHPLLVTTQLNTPQLNTSTEKELFLTRVLISKSRFLMKLFVYSPWTRIFNDREPPWIDNKVKTMIQEKNKIYQHYLKNKSNMLAAKLESLQNLIYETLESCKSKCYENIS